MKRITMKKMKHQKLFLTQILILLIIFAMTPSVHAASNTKRRVVKVAFPEQAGMSQIGQTGIMTGYNYDYLEKISEFTGWEMEYIAYPAEDGNEAISQLWYGVYNSLCGCEQYYSANRDRFNRCR